MHDRLASPARHRGPGGAWSIFSGASSISTRDGHFTGVVQRSGSGRSVPAIAVARPDGELAHVLELGEAFAFDDHNAPGLLELAPREFIAVWTGHNDASVVRVATLRFSEGELAVERTAEVDVGAPAAYAHAVRVDASSRRILVLTRAVEWNPTGVWLDADSLAGSAPFVVFPWSRPRVEDAPELVGRPGPGRPYFVIRQLDDSALIALTTDHPRGYRNGVYAARLRGSAIERIDGTVIRELDDPSPWNPFEALTVVSRPGGEWVPWVNDIAVDRSGAIAVAWSEDRKPDEVFGRKDAVSTDLRYRIATQHGDEWIVEPPLAAGSSLTARERDYAGGFAFADGSADRFAFSSSADPATGVAHPDGALRLYLGSRVAGGTRLRLSPQPRDGSGVLRPRFTRRIDSDAAHGLWTMRGSYAMYTEQSTTVEFTVFTPGTSCFETGSSHVDLPFELREGGGLPEVPQLALAAYVRRAKRVLEFGAGGSTLTALASAVEHVVSVDTDPDLLTAIERSLDPAAAERFSPKPVPTRVLGDWGHPLAEPDLAAFGRRYVERGFEDGQADLVVIDGRFRLACFLEVAARATGPTTVLWDDYAERAEYHAAEQVIAPSKFFKRLAVFSIPGRLEVDPELLETAYADKR